MTDGRGRPQLRCGAAEIGLVVLGVVLALIAIEVLLRLADLGYRVDHNWSYHPRFGWTQVPGASYTYRLEKDELDVSFNREGFRDLDHPMPKPGGVRRIAVVGDSFSEAVQVSLEQTYFRRLERLLNRTGGRWEVLNFGVGDYGTAQQALVLEQKVLAYEPDFVIHQIFPLNDICNNNIALLGLCKSDNDSYRPYGVVAGGELDIVYPQPHRKWLREHWRTYFVVERAIQRVAQRWRDDGYWDERFQEAGYTDLEPLLYSFVPDPPPDRGLWAGWPVTEALIERMVHDTQQAGAQYLALVIPFEARVTPKGWRSLVADRSPAGERMVRDYPESRLGRLFERLGVDAVMLRADLERDRNKALPYRLGHLNPEGHRIAAEALAEAILKAVRNPDPAPGA